MPMLADAVVQTLLRRRLHVTAAAAAVLRDAHAADDVFQQVVLSALESRDHFADSDHLFAWAARTARCRAVDIARRRKLQTLSDEVLDLFEADAAGADGSDRLDALHACLDELPDHARELLRMRYDDGLTAVAVAARLGRTAEAVYQSLSRLHRGLRACVEKRLAPTPTERQPT